MERSSKELVIFGKTLRRIRLNRGYSQEAFAELINVHRTYVGGLERGERNPTLSTIANIAKALKIPIWKLFRSFKDTND